MLINFLKAKQELKFLNQHSDIFHVDIKDGNYVRTFGTTPMFIRNIKPVTTVPIDAHLMINNPENHIEEVAQSGADYITLHSDVIAKESFRIINQIKSLGCKVGIAINPSTPVHDVYYYIELVDKITIMTVDPGYAGQLFIDKTLEKANDLVRMRKKYGLDFLIEVDGSIDKNVYQKIHHSDVDIIVLGGPALFDKSNNIDSAWEIMLNDLKIAHLNN